MTRTVFDNAMAAHVWAAQSQPEGKSSNGNLFFEGPRLFSYGSHYCVGFALPGGVYLINSDSSSRTTCGKHKPAAWRAVGYNRAGHSCPGLTDTGGELYRALFEYQGRNAPSDGPAFLESGFAERPPAERLAALPKIAKHLESEGLTYWPGAEVAALIYKALGASEAEAQRRGEAGAARVSRVIKAEANAKARKIEGENLREAKRLATRPASESRVSARRELVKASESGGSYTIARTIETLTSEAREAFRAAKAAKGKGWAKIAKAARAHYLAIRGELAQYQRDESRYAGRAKVKNLVLCIRGASEQIAQFEQYNGPTLAGGMAEGREGKQHLAACEAGAKGFAQLAEALGALSRSCYAAHVWGPATLGKAHASASEARARSEAYKAQGVAARLALQAQARAAWIETGERPPYDVGTLSDSEGGALLRADKVTRDESGAITGGELVTSWGARVPLTHAIRAFRFLKLCRETGESWAANGHTIRVGSFRVDSVDSSGNFKAGCHAINWQEAARVAEALGLSELASDSEALESSRLRA